MPRSAQDAFPGRQLLTRANSGKLRAEPRTRVGPMPSFSRRSFLAASAAAAVSPAWGALPASREVEIAVIGAGAAGIAAARRIAAAGRQFIVIEAADHIGGRCVTETTTFGTPYDRGAHWLHMPDINPVAKLAMKSGFEIYSAPPGQKIRIGRRFGREGELEDFLAALVRAQSGDHRARTRKSGHILRASAA